MKIIKLTCDKSTELDTEIRFNIATERASREELIRFDINSCDDTVVRHVTKILRRMKSEGAVQVVAPRDSFISEDTEASYINNKYGASLGDIPDFEFIYVKI